MAFDYLRMAASVASRRQDGRSFLLGAVGRRADGALVRASNGPAPVPMPCAHAEARLARKLDVGAEVWVARVTASGEMAMAKPCADCQRTLRRAGVRRVTYSAGEGKRGVLLL